jgi:hypothetical protein
MMGIYNSAFLSSGTMTEHNAKVLHSDFIRLMERSLGFLEREDALEAQRLQIEQERRRLNAEAGPRPAHRIFFLITPFAKEYLGIREAIREVIEDRWQCQLFLALDRKYEDRILDSVRTHMHHADAFIAELTDANPNVMFELGAAFADRRDRPIVQLLNNSLKCSPDDRPKLPADLAGMIYVDYSLCLPPNATTNDTIYSKEMADFLEQEMKKDTRITRLLNDKREKFLSIIRLRNISRNLVSDASYHRLAEAVPTVERWKSITEDEVKKLIIDRDEQDAAELLLLRVKRYFEEADA